ncbi:hypothetical protein T06_7721 [Trichinella sp. T6]|nr:hypothetical protein T06_7721 [Trichinella sp. T6]
MIKCDEKMQEYKMQSSITLTLTRAPEFAPHVHLWCLLFQASSFHLVTAIFIKLSRRKTGSLSWQKIESIACIYMAVKDQDAASDETHESAQSNELPVKFLTHHNFFKHVKYVRNRKKLKWSL